VAHCWFCGRVKGKRSCPARGGDLICSRCCGTKRRVEIRCPADCPYLHGAHDRKWVSEAQAREAARFFGVLFSLEERPAAFFLFLHRVIAANQTPLASLEDRDLEEVVRTATRTLETLAKGVLYRHPAAQAHLQSAADWLVRLIASRKKIPGAPDASDEEALRALQAFASAVQAHAAAPNARERYLEMVSRLITEPSTEREVTLPAELDEPKHLSCRREGTIY
jgi:hypothetical protein